MVVVMNGVVVHHPIVGIFITTTITYSDTTTTTINTTTVITSTTTITNTTISTTSTIVAELIRLKMNVVSRRWLY